jgi:hypothetical protein
MPRPKTDEQYRLRVATLAEEGWRPGPIFREIERGAQEDGRADYPSDRTVRRLYEEWMALPESHRRQQARFRWPASMEEGTLPWEASRSALDLVRYCDDRGLDPPTVAEARWFWRLQVAAPAQPQDESVRFAKKLAFIEYARTANLRADISLPDLEWQLAYEPWKDEDHANAYSQAATRHSLPDYPTSIAKGQFSDPSAQRTYLEHTLGREAADQISQFMADHGSVS